MSNNELEQYRAQYNQLVESLVTFHNASLHFTEYPESYRALQVIRTCIRNIQKTSRTLKSQAKLVHIEGKTAHKEAKKFPSAARKYRSRKKGLENVNSRSNQRTV